MNAKLAGLLGLLFGAISGFFTGKRMARQAYERQLQEEVDSMRKAFDMKKEEETKREAVEKKPRPTPAQKREYSRVAQQSGYTPEVAKPGAQSKNYKIIDEDEHNLFEELGYEAVSLNYYSDGVLTDEHDQPMSSDMITEFLGKTLWKQEFLGNDDDRPNVVYVRNLMLKTDFEITWNDEPYSEFLEEHPETVS